MFTKLIVSFLIFNSISLSVFASEDFYDLLGVSRDATKAQIRRAFKKLAIEKHPDKNPVRFCFYTFLPIQIQTK